MRTVRLFDIGDKVSPTPIWVALHAIMDDFDDVGLTMWQAQEGIGVVKDVKITQGQVCYSVDWRTDISPDYCAWFYEDELRPADELTDFSNIPFNEYKEDWRSVNKKAAVELRKKLYEEITECLKKSMIDVLNNGGNNNE